MRGFVIAFAILVALAFVYHSQAAPIEENPAPAAPEEPNHAAKLLDVDAGGEHGNEASRNARGYGWSYGWSQPWTYYRTTWVQPYSGYGWGGWGGGKWKYWG